MGFEKFNRTEKYYATIPKVSFSKDGYIRFGLGAIREFNLDRFNFVEFYYDKEKALIGLMLCKEETTNTFKFKLHKSSISFCAKYFFTFYKIDLSKLTSVLAEKDKETGMIILNLNKPWPRKNEVPEGE